MQSQFRPRQSMSILTLDKQQADYATCRQKTGAEALFYKDDECLLGPVA
ncbi:MAG: hypothetical protein JRI70_02525 [Deltaproteobacteria bacterium]|nr:hypothetical protein [Deltaproteobacteria bacterium]